MPRSMGSGLCCLKCIVERKNQWLMPPGPLPRQKEITASWKKKYSISSTIWSNKVFMFTCLAGTLPFALTTSLCRAFSMNPSQFLTWHLCIYRDGCSPLLSYEYTIKYKSGPANSNADALSRLPLPANLFQMYPYQ